MPRSGKSRKNISPERLRRPAGMPSWRLVEVFREREELRRALEDLTRDPDASELGFLLMPDKNPVYFRGNDPDAALVEDDFSLDDDDPGDPDDRG